MDFYRVYNLEKIIKIDKEVNFFLWFFRICEIKDRGVIIRYYNKIISI